MTRASIVNEFAKMRHLRVGLLAAMLGVGVVGLALLGVLAAGTDSLTWPLMLGSLARAMALTSPLIVAVIAARCVEIEHIGGGWLMNETAGTTRGALCRSKMVAVGTLVAAGTAGACAVMTALGMLLGAPTPPLGTLVGYTVAATVANLAVLAVHLLLSARIDNQLLPLGVGIVGSLLAMILEKVPTVVAHLTPWGYYALIAPARYDHGELVTLTPAYGSAAALAVVTTGVFALVTRRFDRAEA